jgi:hypothetical protein
MTLLPLRSKPQYSIHRARAKSGGLFCVKRTGCKNQAKHGKATRNYTIPCTVEIEFEVNSLYAAFQGVSDRRKARGKRYELAVVLSLSVLAKLAGQDEPEGMADWVKLRGETLRDRLGLSRETMPHAVTYRRVLGEAMVGLKRAPSRPVPC